LKRGSDPRDLAFRRKHHRKHSLAESPRSIGEILHARSAGEKDRVDRGFVHVAPRGLLPLEIFLTRDWFGLTRHRSGGRVLACDHIAINSRRKRRERAELYEVSTVDHRS